MTLKLFRRTTLLSISVSCSSESGKTREDGKGAAYGWKKSLREGCQNWRTEINKQIKDRKGSTTPECVLESQERGNNARMQIFIFSWPNTFNLKTHSLSMLGLIQTLQKLKYLGDANNTALGRKSSRFLVLWI